VITFRLDICDVAVTTTTTTTTTKTRQG